MLREPPGLHGGKRVRPAAGFLCPKRVRAYAGNNDKQNNSQGVRHIDVTDWEERRGSKRQHLGAGVFNAVQTPGRQVDKVEHGPTLLLQIPISERACHARRLPALLDKVSASPSRGNEEKPNARRMACGVDSVRNCHGVREGVRVKWRCDHSTTDENEGLGDLMDAMLTLMQIAALATAGMCFALVILSLFMLAHARRYAAALLAVLVLGTGWSALVNVLNVTSPPAFVPPDELPKRMAYAMNMGDFIFGMGTFVTPLIIVYCARRFGLI